ncbi:MULTISPECIES: phosphoribosylamine--glycine ligase [unclassified Pseudodesulfovibrio]|uniref:phosphoribosylamine--glycine ligase n=1 Tax=unclassified Pseudodesulfovibrio TaxID=2661612 RepID=UPI000FEBE0D8|nr:MULTISPECIES: phosphoribosylamine--glycine ligase [unclassified Pseudodesulfovibrio]MCJ2165114.1 phosphoribosylamine--glycine ligase [Pseudodesulfovibrio sp. S3-i]RWU03424.1 phosphoribosylamine--glycine ligase [Pseudodesulfovibrio sp. S3]
MKILVVGSGGREHALCWKLSQNPKVESIICAPGNGGTAQVGENIAISDDDIPGLVSLAKEREVGLVVVGPELPLVLGLENALRQEGIPCFGPNAFAANLEGSKAFAKNVMAEVGVPTAPFRVFDEFDEAVAFIRKKGAPIVVKADGLAAGKGVVVATSVEEALEAVEQMMVKKVFGSAGDRVVIEEALKGEEASFLAFCDGINYAVLPSSQDHKAVFDGDTGPNTGGMGAYSPAPILPKEKYAETARICIKPILRHLASKGEPFKGVLYAGLMYTENGPSVIEYNVRFGDPECQPLFMRLETDLLEIMFACIKGKLDQIEVKSIPQAACGVVMAAKGYPGSYPKGMEITGLENADAMDGVKVFQAGTRVEGDKIVTSGGRVLCVTALGDDLAAAKKKAYEAVDKIHFENSFYRRDIADKGLKRSK